jgi:hypothetical protein
MEDDDTPVATEQPKSEPPKSETKAETPQQEAQQEEGEEQPMQLETDKVGLVPAQHAFPLYCCLIYRLNVKSSFLS